MGSFFPNPPFFPRCFFFVLWTTASLSLVFMKFGFFLSRLTPHAPVRLSPLNFFFLFFSRLRRFRLHVFFSGRRKPLHFPLKKRSFGFFLWCSGPSARFGSFFVLFRTPGPLFNLLLAVDFFVNSFLRPRCFFFCVFF